MTLLRPFEIEDTESVVALWRSCGLVRSWNDPYKDIQRKLAEQPELFLVVEEAESIVAAGMAGYDGHRGWVYYLGVAEAQRGRGHARALMNAFEQRLQAIGCPKVQLLVRADNTDVLAFYRQLGYEDSTVVTMGKRLISDT